jgi:hypothetical protein
MDHLPEAKNAEVVQLKQVCKTCGGRGSIQDPELNGNTLWCPACHEPSCFDGRQTKELMKDQPEYVVLVDQEAWKSFVAQWKDKLLKPDIVYDDWWCVELEAACASVSDDTNIYYPNSFFTVKSVVELLNDEGITSGAVSLKSGWGARLSAPGHLDGTTWELFDTEDEAKKYLMEEFGDDE